MKLYYAAGACSFAPHLVMTELDQEASFVAVNLASKECADGDYLKINPKGSVPALEITNGHVLTEAAVIMQYLVDHSKNDTLLPKSGDKRYHVLEWTNYVATEVHKTLGSIFGTMRMYKDEAVKKQVIEQTLALFDKKLQYISKNLGDKKFLMGDDFTIADAYMFTCLSWKGVLNLNFGAYPNIEAYMERISQRPSVQKTKEAEKK